MTDTLGFVVLARRPNGVEPVSAVFPGSPRGLEQAQNVLESCQSVKSPFGPHAAPGPDGVVCAYGCDAWSIDSQCDRHGSNPVEYVVGEITLYEPPPSVLRSGGQTKQFGPRPKIATKRPT